MTRGSAQDCSLQVTPKVTLHGLRWDIDSTRPTIVIAHGINEHIGRYAHVAAALNDVGFSVIGFDHRGHGRSAKAGKRSSNTRHFESLVDDYLEALRSVRNATGRRPIALGHSMGGLIATRAALRVQALVEALILSGPALKIATDMSPVRMRMALTVAKGFFFLKAPEGVTDGLSRDPSVREAFRNDPLCINDPLRMGIAGQLYAYSERTRAQAPHLIMPLLVMHGEADLITDPSGSREFVANAGSPDKTLITWPEDQHEIFNELDQADVIKALTDWLSARFP
ncbi:MAG TPA: lysophospholipase [Thermomicrobiales bacterium]|nr:lysophospholipase [Thermomicrobiales bacterium]